MIRCKLFTIPDFLCLQLLSIAHENYKMLILFHIQDIVNEINRNDSRFFADKISNNYIDKLYSKALKFGAIGVKLLGAGGTGFLLVLAYDHHLIEKNMDCRFLKVNIDQVGSTIIYQD